MRSQWIGLIFKITLKPNTTLLKSSFHSYSSFYGIDLIRHWELNGAWVWYKRNSVTCTWTSTSGVPQNSPHQKKTAVCNYMSYMGLLKELHYRTRGEPKEKLMLGYKHTHGEKTEATRLRVFPLCNRKQRSDFVVLIQINIRAKGTKKGKTFYWWIILCLWICNKMPHGSFKHTWRR